MEDYGRERVREVVSKGKRKREQREIKRRKEEEEWLLEVGRVCSKIRIEGVSKG